MPCAQEPQTRLPRRPARMPHARQRQHESRRRAEPAAEHAAEAFALFGILELVVLRIDVDGEPAFGVDVGQRILVGRDDVRAVDGQTIGQGFGEAQRVLLAEAVVAVGIGQERRVCATAARRRRASSRQTPSAAATRRGTTYPGRSAAGRRVRSGRAGASAAQRPGGASSARWPPCSIPRRPCRRWRRMSVRRPP